MTQLLYQSFFPSALCWNWAGPASCLKANLASLTPAGGETTIVTNAGGSANIIRVVQIMYNTGGALDTYFCFRTRTGAGAGTRITADLEKTKGESDIFHPFNPFGYCDCIAGDNLSVIITSGAGTGLNITVGYIYI